MKVLHCQCWFSSKPENMLKIMFTEINRTSVGPLAGCLLKVLNHRLLCIPIPLSKAITAALLLIRATEYIRYR